MKLAPLNQSTREGLADLLVLLAMGGGSFVTAWMLQDSWPDGAWRFNSALAAFVTMCVLARREFPLEASVAALCACAAGAGVAHRAGLPQEPGLINSLAVGILLASVTRRAPASLAWGAVSGALVVLAATYVSAPAEGSGLTLVTMWFAVLAAIGVAAGMIQRRVDGQVPGHGATSRRRHDAPCGPTEQL